MHSIPPTGTQAILRAHFVCLSFSYCAVVLALQSNARSTRSLSRHPLAFARNLFFVQQTLYASIVPFGQKNSLPLQAREVVLRVVPVVGLEPTRRVSPQDFESSASASFTTPANKNTRESVFFGDPPEIRTPDHRIKSAVLYRLS